ncbi:MAG: Crp/Fnr family transcriptional regulator [Pseudomonadota bacterium]
MPNLLTVGDQPLMSLTPPALATRLLRAGSDVDFQDGALIHSRGDENRGLSIIREGAVRFDKFLANGDCVTVSVLGPGHSFGEATLFAGMGRAYDASAVGETVICQISSARIERLIAEEPALAQVLLIATTRRLYSALGFLDDLRSLTLPQRTAKLLHSMAQSSGDPHSVACRQSDLAFTLGVSRVSIGKALSGLQRSKLIRLGYGRIDIPDPSALERWITNDDQ